MGYGETGTSSNLSDFTYRTHAEAISGIAKAIGAHRFILGGHDWGGMVVYRAAQWLPELVSHVFSVATPYMGVQERYVSNEELVKGPLPQFQYQVFVGSVEEKVENVVQGEVRMRRFLTGMYGGKAKSGRVALTPEDGVDLEMVADEGDEIGPSPLFNEEVTRLLRGLAFATGLLTLTLRRWTTTSSNSSRTASTAHATGIAPES